MSDRMVHCTSRLADAGPMAAFIVFGLREARPRSRFALATEFNRRSISHSSKAIGRGLVLLGSKVTWASVGRRSWNVFSPTSETRLAIDYEPWNYSLTL